MGRSTGPPHGDAIPFAFAMILQILHDLPHQVNSQATHLALFDRPIDSRKRSGQRVEGSAVIEILHVNAVGMLREADTYGIFHSRAAPMPDRIGEQLFQDQVQFEFHLVAESVLPAESSNFGHQTLQLSQVAVEDKFRFGQNCLIVPHWRMCFQAQVEKQVTLFSTSTPSRNSRSGLYEVRRYSSTDSSVAAPPLLPYHRSGRTELCPIGSNMAFASCAPASWTTTRHRPPV